MTEDDTSPPDDYEAWAAIAEEGSEGQKATGAEEPKPKPPGRSDDAEWFAKNGWRKFKEGEEDLLAYMLKRQGTKP